MGLHQTIRTKIKRRTNQNTNRLRKGYNQPKGKQLLRRGNKKPRDLTKKGLRRLGRQGWDPTAADLPAIIPIKIIRPFFNLQGLPKLAMVKLSNPSNDLSLFDTYMMHRLLGMFLMDVSIDFNMNSGGDVINIDSGVNNINSNHLINYFNNNNMEGYNNKGKGDGIMDDSIVFNMNSGVIILT